MKTTITIWSFHREIAAGRMDVRGFLEASKKLGYDAVELLSAYTAPDKVKEARKWAEDLGLKVWVYGASNDFALTGAELDSQVENVKKCIEAAEEIGAPIVRVFGGNTKPGLTFEKGRGLIVEGFYRVAPLAEKAGVTMALENHGRLSCTSDHVLRIIKSVGSPALKSTFDAGNFLIADEDPITAARNLAAQVAHVHVKDHRWDNVEGEPPQVYVSNAGRKLWPETIGEGQIDFAKIFRIFKKAGFTGRLSLEYEGNDPEPEAIARSTANLMRLAAET